MRAEQHPPALHLPLFTYNEDLSGAPAPRLPDPAQEPSSSSTIATSAPFAFSAFFQPSEDGNSGSPAALPALRSTSSSSILREESESFFIGFSWGPTADAFPDAPPPPATAPTPRVLVPQTPLDIASFEFKTPMRRIGTNTSTGARPSTLRRTGTRTAPRRAVSDREAMRQLVDCIGLSARKKVLESGRTPRLARTTTTATKSLRFASLDFTTTNGDSGTLSSALALALAASDDEHEESDGASACTSDAPPSPSPSPGPRPGSAMSRRSVTPVTTQLLYPPQPPTRPSLPPPGDDEDALDVLEERYRALMGEIADIEGKVGAMRRRTR